MKHAFLGHQVSDLLLFPKCRAVWVQEEKVPAVLELLSRHLDAQLKFSCGLAAALCHFPALRLGLPLAPVPLARDQHNHPRCVRGK